MTGVAGLPSAPALPLRMSRAALDRADWAWRSPPYVALDFAFSVRVNDPELAIGLAAVLEPFARNDRAGDPGVVFSVVDRGGRTRRRHVLYRGSELLAGGVSPDAPLATLLWAINRGVADTASGCLLVHAGAAELGGRAVVLPAPTGHGKSTLTAALVRSGLRYVTDETVAVTVGSLVIRPFPKALSIEAGSWAMLCDLEPRHLGALQARLAGQWQVPAGSVRPDAISGGCDPFVIVSPAYRPGGPAELVRTSRAQSVTVLAQNSFNLDRMGRAGFDTAVGLARRCDCYRMAFDDLDEVCALIRALLEGRPPISEAAPRQERQDPAPRPDPVDPAPVPGPDAGGAAARDRVAAGADGPPVHGPIDGRSAPRPAATVHEVDLDGQAVLWDGATGTVHVLNPTATMVWSRFDGVAVLDDVITECTAAYQVERDVVALGVHRLARRARQLGLLEGVALVP